ncbi:Lipid A export ATP-binding/permease protein MsbA [Marinobacterium lacunae]|uniref:Lipid A export ATP-binding/permease protein MsbA n=1 Tax=Marinobacterium lacunae TaxID=1232683 RepID=A0A081FWC3_9GAMM|nr:Lipid A export ATP-binding/permease protein MsbA [Marinobacterium lacunae]
MPSVLSSKRRRGWFLLLVLSGLVLSGALAALFLTTRRLGSTGVEGLSVDTLLSLLLALITLSVGRFVERYGAEVMAQDYVQELRDLVLAHALALSSQHNPRINNGGTLLRLTGDMGAIRNWIVQGMAPLVVLGTWLFASMVTLALLHWTLVIAAVFPLVGALALNYRLGKTLYQVSGTARQKRTRLIRNVTEKLAAIDVVRSFNQSGRERRRFERQGRNLCTALNRRAQLSGLLRGVNEAMMLVTLFALVFCGLKLVSQSLLSHADFAMMLIASLYLLTNLRRLSRVYELWTLKRVASDKLKTFLLVESRRQPRKHNRISRDRRSPVVLQGVAVEGRLEAADATLAIDDRVLVSGPGGSGKSTLLRVLAGLENCTSGRIELAGIRQQSIQRSAWSKAFALVSDELPLLRGTVNSNLFYGRRHFEDDYYRRVLNWTGLDRLMEAGLSLDTTVEAQGSNLSSSVRYRLMLARAMLRRPAYLLIDSHEAHQDTDVVDTLQNALKHYPGGIVICSHSGNLEPFCTQRWAVSKDAGFCVYPLVGNHEESLRSHVS